MIDTVAEIHACPWKGVIAITGCAPGLVTDLLAPGGGSATLLEAVVPYATKSLVQFIGGAPSQYCSEDVAKEMASSAFSRATELLDNEDESPVFGLGITATLRKNGPEREGRTHQVFISFQSATMVYHHHVVFNSKLSRLDEEHLVTQVALDILSRHLLDKRHKIKPALSDGRVFDILDGREDSWFVQESTAKQQFPANLQDLLDGNNEVIWDYWSGKKVSWPSGGGTTWDGATRAVISGSFNPFHGGHREMVNLSRKHFGTKPIVELSISNVDKGRLSGYEILKRGQSFKEYCRVQAGQDLVALLKEDGLADLYFTNAPSFVEKSFLFPGSVFVVGIDTWYRLIDIKYYRHDPKVRDDCLAKIKENGCSFLVLGRFVNGTYHTLPTDPSPTWKDLATGLSEEEFRIDISSTQVRAQ